MAILRITALLILLAACGCTRATYLTKPGLNDAMFARDSQACAEYLQQQSLFYECMGTRGYTTSTTVMSDFRVIREQVR
ncbi:MAG TPA: hypothetical protein VGH50_05315 [Candidatus Binatia bacterium]|jgi:hypothetical protein